MTRFLDIHLASDAERVAAHENCHDVWSLGLSVADHVKRRENSALHQRARWIVGCLEDRVVAALASHPLVFRLHGRPVPGIGIASVHTLQEFRGQGFAQRLIRWIEPYERDRGARLSVLFCDIEPHYYERLGYVLCPSHIGWAETAGRKLIVEPSTGYGLQPAPTGAEFSSAIGQYAELYDSDHGRRVLAIDRSPDYWQHLAARQPNDERYWLVGAGGQQVGYVWLRAAASDLLIDDHAVRDGDADVRAALFAQVTQLATGRGVARVGGWMPASSPASEHFAIFARRDEITMFKPLEPRTTLDSAGIAAADWLQEIDHV